MFENCDFSCEKIVAGAKPPIGFYRKSKNRIALVRYLVEICLGRKDNQKIYPLKVQDFKQYNLYGFLTTYYNCSPKKALQEAYKEELKNNDIFNNPQLVLEQLTNFQIKEPPRGFWLDLNNRNFTIKFLVETLLQKSVYDISADDFTENNLGGFLVHYYKGSPHRAIKEAYPEVKDFLFHRINPQIWEDETIRKEAINHFVSKIPPETKKITMKTLLNLGLKHSLSKFYGGDIKKLLNDLK
jgi:hypothetical protein